MIEYSHKYKLCNSFLNISKDLLKIDFQHNFICKFYSLIAIVPLEFRGKVIALVAINDMESHGKSSDYCIATEAIDAWNKRNSAKPLSFQKQPNLASKDIASKIFIAPKELSNNRKLLKVWNLKLSNLLIHEKEGLFLLLLLQLFLLQQFDAQPFSSQTELESYRSVSGSISVFFSLTVWHHSSKKLPNLAGKLANFIEMAF